MLKQYFLTRQSGIFLMSEPPPVYDTVCHPVPHTDSTCGAPVKTCRTDVLAGAVSPVVFFNRGIRKVFPFIPDNKRLQRGGELLCM